MISNIELQKNVQDAIRWQPSLHGAEIGVTVHEGVVTLTGTVDSYPKKLEAETATKTVAGVKAVVEKIEVHHHEAWSKLNDNEIAEAIMKAYKWNWKIPNDKIIVKVENGWVTLSGEMVWNYQKEAAKNALKNLDGIAGVINNITIKSDRLDAMEKEIIEHHLQHSWALNPHEIKVKVDGTNVTLTGTVSSLYQKEEAERIAWNTPGIWSLNNDLEIKYFYSEKVKAV
jgi:osmotically-inducible protein OsmY